MRSHGSFFSPKKFYGEEHFPYGISRSGEFNRNQAALLEDHGTAYQELHSGHREPCNDEERAFVLVCKGEKVAQTMHELAWMRYCQKAQEGSRVAGFIGRPPEGIGSHPSSDEEW